MVGYPQPLAKVPVPAISTKIMETQDFKPQVGDLYIPDDMQQMFGGGKPVYQNKNMVLIGTMGSGKTTLYNKLTNSNEKTSNGARTCTRKNASKKGLNIELQITDTPGLALDGGVSVDDSLEVRKALTVGDVTQIVVVQSLPNNGRVSALETSLAPIQKIMSCDTFRLDASGNDCWITRKERTPYRTRVFLVLTHRDNFQGPPRNEWQEYIESVREKFSWIGPVAMIDTEVTVEWLYKSIVACAGYTPLCNVAHHIPVLELFAKFPMDFTLTAQQRASFESQRLLFLKGIQAAHKEVEGYRPQGEDLQSGEDLERGQRLTCVLRFLHALYELSTKKAVLDLCDVSHRDDSAADSDKMDMCEDRTENRTYFEAWGAVSAEFAPLHQEMVAWLRSYFPQIQTAGVYKKCPRCGAIYASPSGPRSVTRCPGRPARGAKVPFFTFDFDLFKYNLTIFKMDEDCETQSCISQCFSGILHALCCLVGPRGKQRRGRTVVDPSHMTEDLPQRTNSCNFPLEWGTMPCATRLDLIESGIASEFIEDDILCDTDSVSAWLKELELSQYDEDFKRAGIHQQMLGDLTQDQLRELGVTNKFHIRKMLKRLPQKTVAVRGLI